ncbi:uncharacterized protein Dwil_GK21333 [Drosophila willistoni]|uniref:GK21333 n=1 Tax=Drosophila willistoni TaxID=7260 RepID=B4MR37_DROWI|nr:C-type lectin 37Da [Drosophila willistoni]EDW74576.1 uncharacterized protein Dwil_GK21333 [Drosophila willistoni]
MKVVILIALLVVGAWASSTEEPSESSESSTPASPSQIAFSPFLIYDDRFALGTFAKVNWFQAQATCAANGYTLASINSEYDQQRIRNFFYTRGHSQLHLLNQPIWTSGTDLADTNNWVWFGNGRSFTYRNFQNDSPTYSNGSCLGVNGITSLWLNENCSNLHYFLCERRCAEGGDYYR